jgi:PIN domain nuclease of toxin-antitoxin system
MVLIELEYLHEIGRVRLGARDVLRKLSQEIGLIVCDLSFPSVAEAALDEKWTRDPFDRAIVAQAKANGLALLISADEEIRQHYPRAIW